MARIRTIKPEFPQSESVGRLSRDARLLFIQLWTAVDDDGRCRGNSRLLASSLYPYDDDAIQQIEGWLKELEDQAMIRRYVVDGATYLDIPKWSDHQRIEKPRKSSLPPFPEPSPIPPGNISDASPLDWNGMEGEMEMEGEDVCSETDEAPSSEPTEAEPIILAFPCDGKKPVWPLTGSRVLQWSLLYPSLDVEGECRRALAWIEANPTKRKTFHGMPKFLVNWFNRAQNSGNGARDGPANSPSRYSKPTTRKAPAYEHP